MARRRSSFSKATPHASQLQPAFLSTFFLYRFVSFVQCQAKARKGGMGAGEFTGSVRISPFFSIH
jgi:hypothetical protein